MFFYRVLLLFLVRLATAQQEDEFFTETSLLDEENLTTEATGACYEDYDSSEISEPDTELEVALNAPVTEIGPLTDSYVTVINSGSSQQTYLGEQTIVENSQARMTTMEIEQPLKSSKYDKNSDINDDQLLHQNAPQTESTYFKETYDLVTHKDIALGPVPNSEPTSTQTTEGIRTKN